MTTITKERIELFVKSPLENGLTRGEQMDLARIALASLDAEPVGEVSDKRHGLVMDGTVDLGGKSTYRIIKGEKAMKRLPLGTKFYIAPPAPVVPDEWTIQDAVKFCRETGRQDAGSAMEAWNACRAAMLNAEPLHATPKGNRLRIAEGKLAEYSLSKREPQPTPESADRKMLKRLAVIMSGSDSGGEISALTVTAQSLVDRCKALALSTSQEPQPLTLANETMDVERLCEIAEEDNGSDVKFECSVMARMLLSVALNSDPVAYTDAEELESLEGVDGHSYAHLWPNSYGFGKDIALYTVPQMMPLPVNILDDETNRDVFEAWVADYTGYTKGFVRQFRVDDKYRSDSMWNKYWNTWNACRTAMLNGGKS